jgi:hypothetical protein
LLLPFAAHGQALASATGVAALSWKATGELPGAGGLTRLQMETRVEPFVRARTRSWLEQDGPSSARTLIVEPDGAWVERDGGRKPLPPRQVAHERAQYGLYGYLLDQSEAALPQPRQVRRSVAGYPPITFSVDRLGTIREARYRVPDYASDGTIDQHLLFEQLVEDQGVEFPRIITILVDDKLSFRMTIDRFTVQPA